MRYLVKTPRSCAGIMAAVLLSSGSAAGRAAKPLRAELLSSTDSARDARYGGSVALTNQTEEPLHVTVELSLQQDGALYSKPIPDPVDGSDHALGARSWTVAESTRIAENTLVDGLDYTNAATTYRTAYWTEADQFVELDRARTITSLGWRAGDANWIWLVDISRSADGTTFTPIPELQRVSMHKKWGEQRFPAFQPCTAKQLRFHYHNAGKKVNIIRMPTAIHVWDGAGDERIELPAAGKEVGRLHLKRTVPAGSPATVPFEFTARLPTGQYLLGTRITAGNYTEVRTRHVFVEPPRLEGVNARSRFGLNAARSSLAPEHRKLGIGWVRFENFKWPMVSPAPHEYAFDGTVKPWVLDHDRIMRDYRAAGIHVLPMMFLTPLWASGADTGVPSGIRLAMPPREYADFGEFVFQSVARYGNRKVAAEQLKTTDKATGLGLITHYELGNEPDLNPLRDPEKPPTWGAWAGTMPQFWDMWRHGAEAIKRADPTAVVPSPGFAGMTSETVDQLRTHRYPDGKRPLDFVELLSVHFYSGRTPPEVATRDANNATGYEVRFIEHLKRLVEWRDRHKPGAPIWMTETGYDTAGPIGTDERTQAARLPRVVALCLASGLDKVLVYRETGSTPSQHAASGVLRNDLSRRPSWYTYATLIRQLHQAEPGRQLCDADDTVWLQTWKRGGSTVLMAYCVTGEGTLGVELGSATVTDAFGGVTRVTSTRGLELTEFPVYITDIDDEAALAPRIAAATARERARLHARTAAADRQVYLFNFGDPAEPVPTNIGRIRYYTAVPKDCLYDKQKGYGFVGKPAARNDYTHWLPGPLEQYGTKFDKGHVFRWNVEPGRYELRIKASPWGSSADLILEGAEGGSRTFTFSGGKRGQLVTGRVTARGRVLELKGTYQHLLRWLVLEEIEE